MADRPLPAPSALPSLPAAFSRRAALFGTVAATGFLGAAAASALPARAPAPAGRIATLYGRYRALIAAGTAMPATEDDEAADAALDAALALQEDALLSWPTTLAEAVVALDWARHEFAAAYVEDSHAVDRLDRWTLAMMDGALGLLRDQVAGVAA